LYLVNWDRERYSEHVTEKTGFVSYKNYTALPDYFQKHRITSASHRLAVGSWMSPIDHTRQRWVGESQVDGKK
jgi:hypothetical protein